MESEIIRLRKEKKTIYEISDELKCPVSKVYRVCINNKLNNIGLIGRSKPIISDETKKKMSDSKKLLYKNHPEKHNWKRQNKCISKPCEEFKKILDEIGIIYVPELTPLKERFFSIDIAFPEKKIGIEINGNQHYNSDGTLNKYYQNRHDLIQSDGWKLHEIHFSICYNRNEIIHIINSISESKDIFSFDYHEFLLSKLNKKRKIFFCKCGGEKDRYSNQCSVCQHLDQRKIKNRPTNDQLLLDTNNIGYSATGRKYGVSDNTIRKWLKNVDPLGFEPKSPR